MNRTKIILLGFALLTLLGALIYVLNAAHILPGTVFAKIYNFKHQQFTSLNSTFPTAVPLAVDRKKAHTHVDTRLSVSFAVIGDFGLTGKAEADIASEVQSWSPDFIVAVGDNNYELGAAGTIDANVGQYYHSYIYPYSGSYGAGAKVFKFFPVLGNHDWITSGAQPYTQYFELPGNKRYYDFIQGPVHFFMLDSDPHEPDGITSTSTQSTWLKTAMAASISPWNIVVLHHAPYSSGKHGSTTDLQWPFQVWGADAVLAGHDHTYEQLLEDNIPYFVDGLGGSTIYDFGDPLPGSRVRYNTDYGAMRVWATDTKITFEFIDRSGALIDSFSLNG